MKLAGVLLAFCTFATPARSATVDAGIQDLTFAVRLSNPMTLSSPIREAGAAIVDDD